MYTDSVAWMEIACLAKSIKGLAVKRLSGRPKRRELRIDAVLALCSISILGSNLNVAPQAQGKGAERAGLSGRARIELVLSTSFLFKYVFEKGERGYRVVVLPCSLRGKNQEERMNKRKNVVSIHTHTHHFSLYDYESKGGRKS